LPLHIFLLTYAIISSLSIIINCDNAHLPEQQLRSSSFPNDTPVWVVYGKDDPWTPPKRVENLIKISGAVEKVIGLEGAGHCPHDEKPDEVNGLILEFLDSLEK